MRLAQENDIPFLKIMYRSLIKDMKSRGLEIWDDIYPVEFLDEDVARQRLHVFEDGNEIVAACALSQEPEISGDVKWDAGVNQALYVDRLGVAASHCRQGIGKGSLRLIEEWAREQGCESVRLFVAVDNMPARLLYDKCRFFQVEGLHREVFDDGSMLEELGFEKVLG